MPPKKNQKLYKASSYSGSLSQADFVSKLIAIYNSETTYDVNKFAGIIGDKYQDAENKDVIVKLTDVISDSDGVIFVELECIACEIYRTIPEIFPHFSFKNIELERKKNVALQSADSEFNGLLCKGVIVYIPANYFNIYFTKIFPDKWDELEKILQD